MPRTQPEFRGPAPVAYVFRPEPASVGAARRFVAGWCEAAAFSDDVCDTAVLLTSEVVTNAFTHGRSEAHVTAACTPQGIHVAVTDGNSRYPEVVAADPDALSGRGLTILAALASRWGVQEASFGKTVWFELDVRSGGI